TLPVGAFVILDRRDGPVPTRLDPMPPDLAMDALLYQNFTRDRHSADILRLVAASLSTRPVFRLTYFDLSEAVDCLQDNFHQWPEDRLDAAQDPVFTFRQAEPAPLEGGKGSDAALFRQRAGSLALFIGKTLYLADAEGRAIHRMDPLAAALWALMEDPMSVRDLVDLTVEAFADATPRQVKADIKVLVARLCQQGLIEGRG
ncbi:MAG: PqqD family peptide modification chaperone, partial [Acetobacteraceae bacterium]